MAKKKSEMQKLSPIARKIAELVDTVGGGSQRAFARQINCSQPVISRVLNGQQGPGRDLIEKIAGLAVVDGDELRKTFDESQVDPGEDYLVPIASCLLDGEPTSNKDKLTPASISVSRAIYSPTLYAVRAGSCQPAVHDPAQRFLKDDLVLIESSTSKFRDNLQALHEKLCALVVGSGRQKTITLQRIWVTFEKSKWVATTWSDSEVGRIVEKKWGKEPRAIMLVNPENKPKKQNVETKIETKHIVGIGVQLIRNI